jgi:8-oxo-dGTP pyrophosphatase MutT (NUDIX family)
MLDLDADRPAVDIKDAATVLPLRVGDDGLEVFCVRRHAQSAFLGGAVVFPGGKLDGEDGEERWHALSNGVHPRASVFANDAAHAHALLVCACRESLEELGVQLDTRALVPFGRWVTPKAEQRRYDARFYLLHCPAGQHGRHDQRETVSSVWSTPQRMLEAHLDGQVFLAPPTTRALELLSPCADVAAALALCADQSLLPVCPEFVPDDPPALVLPGDPAHSLPERRVDGATRFVLSDGKFLSADPPS